MLLSKCTICGKKKSRVIKKQEASGNNFVLIILNAANFYWQEINLCLKCI